MTQDSDIFGSIVRTIIFFIVVFAIYRFVSGWRSYDSQFTEIRTACLKETKFTQSSTPLVVLEALGEATKTGRYCTCVSDRAKQYVSKFDMALTVGSYGRIKRFDPARLMRGTSMQNERRLCRPLLD